MKTIVEQMHAQMFLHLELRQYYFDALHIFYNISECERNIRIFVLNLEDVVVMFLFCHF